MDYAIKGGPQVDKQERHVRSAGSVPGVAPRQRWLGGGWMISLSCSSSVCPSNFRSILCSWIGLYSCGCSAAAPFLGKDTMVEP
eukprot:2748502-Amphidinium_carterae.1